MTSTGRPWSIVGLTERLHGLSIHSARLYCNSYYINSLLPNSVRHAGNGADVCDMTDGAADNEVEPRGSEKGDWRALLLAIHSVGNDTQQLTITRTNQLIKWSDDLFLLFLFCFSILVRVRKMASYTGGDIIANEFVDESDCCVQSWTA